MVVLSCQNVESCRNAGFRLAYHTWEEADRQAGDKLTPDVFESKAFLFQTRDFSRSQPHVPTPGKAFAAGNGYRSDMVVSSWCQREEEMCPLLKQAEPTDMYLKGRKRCCPDS